jgi:hypothetical protein
LLVGAGRFAAGGPARVARERQQLVERVLQDGSVGRLDGAGQGEMQHQRLKARGKALFAEKRMWARERARTNAGAGIPNGAPAVGKRKQMAASGWPFAWLWNALLIAAREREIVSC